MVMRRLNLHLVPRARPLYTMKGCTHPSVRNHHVCGHPDTMVAGTRIAAFSNAPNRLDLARECVDDSLGSVDGYLLAPGACAGECRVVAASAPGRHAAFEV